MKDATVQLLDSFVRVLGRPVATPELVRGADGKLERPRFRVWRWGCPVCRVQETDPDRIWRPLAVDSDDHVTCNACGCSPEELGAAVRELEETIEIVRVLPALVISLASPQSEARAA
jgi:hypothetical protein